MSGMHAPPPINSSYQISAMGPLQPRVVEAAAFLVPPRFAHLPFLMNLPSAVVPQAGELSKEHRISQQGGGSKKLDCNCGKVKSWASDTEAFQRQPYGVGLVSNGLQLKRRIISSSDF